MPSKMRVLDRRSQIARTVLAAAAGSWFVTWFPPPAMAQAGAMRPAQETLDIGDEPGRISTE